MIRFEIKLLLVFAIFFVGVVGLILIVDMRTERELVEGITKDLENLVRTVHFSTQKLSSMRGPDREKLERFIEETKRSIAVKEVSVVSRAEEVVASSNPKKVGQRHALTGREIFVRARLGEKEPRDRHIRYEVRIPLIRNDRVIGLMETSLLMEDYRFLLRQLYFKNLLIAAGILLFAFGAVFFILNRMNQPLRRLISAANRVASGDLDVQLPVRSHDEVGKLTASFNVMTQKLAEQQSLEEKLRGLERRSILAETASSLAHEIRNPLNLINLTADHLSQQFQPEKEESRQVYHDLIRGLKAEVKQLNQMVNEFLNVGRPAQMKRSRFAWAELLDQVQRSTKHQLTSKGVTLESPGPADLWITADKEQMKLALLNLILNAIEAVSQNGRIQVVAEEVSESGEILISIQDDGPGIAAEDLSRIFEPYFTKRPGGTGLGLALVRRIVEEHGGKIQAANLPEGGARFEIRLPVEG
jgi:nitrogen fixation/metabolism regulation signal transduction histidine kinase